MYPRKGYIVACSEAPLPTPSVGQAQTLFERSSKNCKIPCGIFIFFLIFKIQSKKRLYIDMGIYAQII